MNRTQVAKELVKTRKAVKRKYQSLKSDITEAQHRKEQELKPITEPLRELIKTVKAEPLIMTEEPFFTPQNVKKTYSSIKPLKKKIDPYHAYLPTQTPSFLRDDELFETSNDDVFLDNTDFLDQPTGVEQIQENILNLTKTPAYDDYLELYDPLVRAYVDSSIKGTRELDHTHGLVHDTFSEKWKLGNTLVDFDKNDFKVNNLTYKGTPGLYELLFYQDPVGYTSEDLKNYMDILKRTNAYRRNYDPNDQIQGTTDRKYTTIIKPYLIKENIINQKPKGASIPSVSGISKPKPPVTRPRSTRLTSKTGMGMMNLSNKKIDYIYYDDVNELVNRLKLLVSSQTAGHTGHENEIIAILEELREAKVIE